MTSRPLILPLLGMVGGLLSAHHLNIFLTHYLLPVLLIVTLVCAILKSRIPFLFLLAVLFFAWGNAALQPFLRPSFPPNHLVHFVSQIPVTVEGIVATRPEAKDEGMRFVLAAERVLRDGKAIPVEGRLMVHIREGRGNILTGDRVRLAARLRQPMNLGLPGEFDYRRYLAYRQIYVTASVLSDDNILLMREAAAYPFQRRFDRLAKELGDFIGKRFPAEGGILRAILVGERGYVNDRTEEIYARAGVNHILSISGFHIGIIAITIYYLLLRLLARSEFLALCLNLRSTVLLVALPPVVFYLYIAGLAPATVRSVIMIAIGTIALLLERETDPINTLTAAAFSILLFTPQTLFDISFQLSFLAIWGLIILTPLFMKPFSSINNTKLKNLLLFVAASAAAITVTLLPVAHMFHRTSVAGLIGNFVAVPLLGYGAVVTGFASLPLIHLAPDAAHFLLGIAAWLVRLSGSLIEMIARIPPLPLKSVSLLDLSVFYPALLGLTLIKTYKMRYSVCVLVIATLFMLHIPAGANSTGMLKITFFSIGQGESTLITFPDGRHMLVDGGGSLRDDGMDIGTRYLAPALWSMGVDRLDVVVLSHPHPDHLKGLISLAELFPIGEFWESGIEEPVGDHVKLRSILAGHGVPVRNITSATPSYTIGNVRITPLAPAPDARECNSGQNDNSLVFRLIYGKFSMLFTGDIGDCGEKRLLRDPDKLGCTVLKIPHHGSRHSTTPMLLDVASPRLAFISAGAGNSFGLPSPETISKLHKRGISVFRTDLHGTVEVTSDGNGYNIRTSSDGHFH